MGASQLLVQTVHDVTVVSFQQRAMLDSANIEAVAADLYVLVEQRAIRKLVLDFTQVQFLSSQALGMLITLKKKVDANKGEMAICGLKDELQQIFRIMKLEKVFRFYPGETEALAHFDVHMGG
jgi:anti-sigma B factor antagonist